MRKKIVLKIILLLILVIGIVFLSYNYLNSLNDNVLVYVAASDIEPQEIIDEHKIKRMEIGFNEKVNFFNKAYSSNEDIIGAVANQRIKEGDVFQSNGMVIQDTDQNNVIDQNGNVNSDYFINENKRIAFISIEENNALGGMVKKGDYIDIVFTSMNDSTGGLYTSLLLQKVPVFEVKKNSNSSMLLDVYFEVKPEEGLVLSMAKYHGKLDFMLTTEEASVIDLTPVLPEKLYEKILEAGYQMIDETEEAYNTYENTSENMSITELEKEMTRAKENLEAVFAAMNAAKITLENEKDNSENLTTEDDSLISTVQKLEKAVRDLEGAVSKNKEILEGLNVEISDRGGNEDD